MNLLKNLSESAKLKIKLAAGIILVTIVMFLLLRDNSPEPIVLPDSKPVSDRFDSTLKKYEEMLKKDSTAYYKGLYDNQLEKVTAIEKKLSVEQRKVVSLAAQVTMLKTPSDTSAHSRKCDSLVASIPPLIEEIESYKEQNDSLKLAHLKEREVTDAKIEAQRITISEFKAQFLDMKELKEQSDNKVVSLNKKIKNERTFTKVVAVVGAIAVGALLIK